MNATAVASPRYPELPLAGGCLCRAIRYEITARPLLLYACHCTNCQRQSGSAFAMNMPVAADAFRIVQGEPKGWHRLSPSGVPAVSWFCGECAGRTHGTRPSLPDTVTVRAGTLDDTTWLIPVAHMYVGSAQPWVALPAADCFDEAPADFRSLAIAWQAKLQRNRQ